MPNKVLPILKYTGGKMREVPTIKHHLPARFNNYFEPFVGGGAVWLNVYAKHYFINDLSTDLMNLYKLIKDHNKDLIKYIKQIAHAWKMPYVKHCLKYYDLNDYSQIKVFINQIFLDFYKNTKFLGLSKKQIKDQLSKSVLQKAKNLNRKMIKSHSKPTKIGLNALTSVKASLYTLLRTVYNYSKDPIAHVATYWIMREYGYSSMFRFNRHGKFNIPYGGISYNNKSILLKLHRAYSNVFQNKIKHTDLSNQDYQSALKAWNPGKHDFVFLDPPYDTKFSTYDKNVFGKQQQIQLAKFIKYHLKANWMMVIQATPLMDKLYKNGESVVGGDGSLHIKGVSKTYMINFRNRNRNNQKVEYLIITNYRSQYKQTSLL